MTVQAEDRRLEEQLEIEGTEDEFSESRKSKITYTRALLLELTEVEACSKLPGDFDLLVLSQLNAAVYKHCEEDLARPHMEKNKRTSSDSSVLEETPSGRWRTGLPGERWDRLDLMPSKESHSQIYCSTERSDVVSQQLPQESRYDAVISGQKTPKSALFRSFQLTKNGNPYRPPHLNKNLRQPSDTFSELGVESSKSSSFSTVESDQRGSSDSITGNNEPMYVSPLASEMIGANDKTDSAIIDDNGVESSESSLFSTVESGQREKNKRTSSDSSVLGESPSGRWHTGFPGEIWDRLVLMPSKESHSQGYCSSERSDVVSQSQQLPQESRYDDVVSGQKTPKSSLFRSFQLKKNGNPYRPPHLNKNLRQPSDTFSELGVESSESSSFSTVESDQIGSSDSITGNNEPMYVSPLASEMIGSNDKPDSAIIDDNGVESSESSLFSTVESGQRGSSDSITGNDEPVYVSPLASEMVGANGKPDSRIIDDNGPIYEDLWAEILEKQLQEYDEASCRDKKASGTLGATDKLELGIIDGNENTYEDYWADILESLRQQQEAELGPISGPDAEVDICLPDEDSLISVDYFDMLDNRNDAAISETEIIGPNEDSLISVNEMKGPYSSVPVDIGKPFFQLGNNNRMNFHAKSNYIPYIPSLNCFNFSNFFYPSCFTGTNPNDSLIHYSLSQQPYIYPRQQYHPPVGMMCRNPVKQMASQQTTYQGLGKSNAGYLSNKKASGFWHAQC